VSCRLPVSDNTSINSTKPLRSANLLTLANIASPTHGLCFTSELTAAETHPPAHPNPLIGLDSIDGGALGFLIFRFAGRRCVKTQATVPRIWTAAASSTKRRWAACSLSIACFQLELVGLEEKVFLSSNRRCCCWRLGLLAPLHDTTAKG
jgi:hypothetical protein